MHDPEEVTLCTRPSRQAISHARVSEFRSAEGSRTLRITVLFKFAIMVASRETIFTTQMELSHGVLLIIISWTGSKNRDPPDRRIVEPFQLEGFVLICYLCRTLVYLQ